VYYETIMHNIEVLYAQATIRYARLLDIDYAEDLSTVDHRAEGQAFYRIIAPIVAAADTACHNTMDQLYNFDKTPVPGVQYYCEAVTCIPAALGITETELGTLEDTDGVCEGTERKFRDQISIYIMCDEMVVENIAALFYIATLFCLALLFRRFWDLYIKLTQCPTLRHVDPQPSPHRRASSPPRPPSSSSCKFPLL
jgi:hypothetical protein